MGEEMSYVDRISELPDFILHQMLSYLSTKEAAQTCVISKRWKHVWETFPILDCKELYFGRELDMLNPKVLGIPKDERREIYDKRLRFMSYVDEKLRRFHEENLCVNKFLLHITLVSNRMAPRVDMWMDLVADLCVRELELYLTVGRKRFYDLPIELLAMESLTILNLKGNLIVSSRLDRNINAVKLSSLIELHLMDVSINEDTIQDLIFSIHSMKVFSLKNCLGFDKLEICDHDKLKRIVYYPHRDFKVKKLSIKLPTLEELSFRSFDKDKTACENIVSSVCQNLKFLCLCGIPIDSKLLQSMISSFPLLEELVLVGCVLQENMKLSSRVLKRVRVYDCMNLVEAEFDTPNVDFFKYCGKNMPNLYISSVGDYRIAEISVRLENMDGLWFRKLKNFLLCNKFEDLTLVLTAISEKEIPVNFFMATQFWPFRFPNMQLVSHILTSVNYATLLDGLFWILRPRILSLELSYYSPQFVKGLLRSLVMEERPKCHCFWDLKCWRHSLKDIKVIALKGFRTNTVLNAITLKDLTTFLDDWAIEARRAANSYPVLEGEKLSIQLSWTSSIVSSYPSHQL